MHWLRKIFGRTKFPGVDYQVKYAFTVKGVDYYEMDDLMNQPYERAVTCLIYYEEFNQRVTRDYLLQHVKAVSKALQVVPGQALDYGKAIQLNKNLEERLNWIIDGDLAYKLASVVFFDKNENPSVYDHAYNQKKIAFWKKEATAKDFFFTQPLLKLIPFLKDYESNLETYLAVTESVKQLQQKNLTEYLSKN